MYLEIKSFKLAYNQYSLETISPSTETVGGVGQGRDKGGRKSGKTCGSMYRQLSLHSLPVEKSTVIETIELTSVWLWLFFISYPGYAK